MNYNAFNKVINKNINQKNELIAQRNELKDKLADNLFNIGNKLSISEKNNIENNIKILDVKIQELQEVENLGHNLIINDVVKNW